MLGGNAAHIVVLSPDKKKILLTQRRDIPMWVLPGGHIQQNESYEQAAVREFKEETGLTVKITHKVAVFTDKKNKIEKYLFLGEVKSGKMHTSAETKKVEWFDRNKLPMLMTQYERDRITLVSKFQGKTFNKRLYFNKKKELFFQLKNPVRFCVFLFTYLRNERTSHSKN